jgi:hypothetical protein
MSGIVCAYFKCLLVELCLGNPWPSPLSNAVAGCPWILGFVAELSMRGSCMLILIDGLVSGEVRYLQLVAAKLDAGVWPFLRGVVLNDGFGYEHALEHRALEVVLLMVLLECTRHDVFLSQVRMLRESSIYRLGHGGALNNGRPCDLCCSVLRKAVHVVLLN